MLSEVVGQWRLRDFLPSDSSGVAEEEKQKVKQAREAATKRGGGGSLQSNATLNVLPATNKERKLTL